MNIRIKKVKKGMGNTFIDYFRDLDFAHEPHWGDVTADFTSQAEAFLRKL